MTRTALILQGAVDAVLALFKEQGYGYASVVGEMCEGEARVTVES